MKETRSNAGYIILDSIHVGKKEYVLGYHQNKDEYITWSCRNGLDYNEGYYYVEALRAKKIYVTGGKTRKDD